MREILFRGKCLFTGEWVYGSYLPDTDTLDENTAYILTYELNDPDYVYEKVDPYTVGQYTGRKDKNGEDVYEADILTDKFGSMGVVEWRDSGFVVNFGDTDIFDLSNCFGDSYQMWVVGNIHDNADLIEANTRLIAAAPEMLEALQNLVFLHSCEQEGIDSAMPTRGQWMDAISKAEKAINKALGR